MTHVWSITDGHYTPSFIAVDGIGYFATDLDTNALIDAMIADHKAHRRNECTYEAENYSDEFRISARNSSGKLRCLINCQYEGSKP